MIREICSTISIDRYSFFRAVESLYKCCCVARSIRGNNQAVNISRGDANGSEKKVSDTLHKLFGTYSTKSVKMLTRRLQVIMLIHIM